MIDYDHFSAEHKRRYLPSNFDHCGSIPRGVPYDTGLAGVVIHPDRIEVEPASKYSAPRSPGTISASSRVSFGE